ncbi:MAG: multiple sugar transport system substrate-binding protein [Mycobacterium sp.]|jgi:ABC-type glycerol-3-phosphate transport system substrate-binding protein|nr:multiple sugar transport system substrate-binding protein [Pseudonocardiales bacterium]MDT5325463.1 multiple sugar transport system substrate-binding protein [Mycobacterium sp.]
MKPARLSASIAVLVAASLLAAGCSSSKSKTTNTGSSAANKPVTISVASLIPGSTKEATQQFNNQVAQFVKANPTIKVKSVQYQWTGPTFAAKLAAGTLPTVFTVPFTDGRTLGENGQLADLTKEVKALPYFTKFNPGVIAEGTTSDGKVIAVPTAAYAQALHYNRKLFQQAGLDPNSPPKTWDEVVADAKQITQKTGKAGFAEMGKNDNSAGWILTTLAYSLGGRMEEGTGKDAKATLDNDATKQALQMLHTLRWDDKAMGSNFDWGWSDINQAFAAGQVGMFVNGSDIYTNLVQASKIDPSIYGVTTIPVAANDQAGVLGGGTLAAVRPDANAAEKAAAVKWIDFFYEQPLIDKTQAMRNAQTLIASKQPVGVPALPVFDETQYKLANTWIKSYINVPQEQMSPFTTGIFDQKLIPEPAASTQSVYHALDSAVQAVLTNKSANIDQLLKTANGVAQSAIQQGK